MGSFKRFSIIAGLSGATLVLPTAIAWAASSDAPPTDLTQMIFTAVATAIAGVIFAGAKKLMKKWDVETSDKTEEAMRQAAYYAVLFAEEQAAAAAAGKSNEFKVPMTFQSGAKLDIASKRLIDSFPKLSTQEAEKRVTEALKHAGLGSAISKGFQDMLKKVG